MTDEDSDEGRTVERVAPGTFAPIGVQPRDDSHVLCLECGRWYKALPTHIAFKHDIHARDYKARHGLMLTSPLVSEEGSRDRRERSYRILEAHPEIAEAIVAIPRDVRAARVRNARKDENPRTAPGYIPSRRARDAKTAETLRVRAEQQTVDRIHQAGYDGWDDLIVSTAHESADTVGAMIAVSGQRVREMRRGLLGDKSLYWRAAPKLERAAREHGWHTFVEAVLSTDALSERTAAGRIGVSHASVRLWRKKLGL